MWEWHHAQSSFCRGLLQRVEDFPLQSDSPTEFPLRSQLCHDIPTPKSSHQFAPLHQFLKRESAGSVGKYMRENMLWSPLPCSAAPCWETTLMMLVQSPGSHQRKKTPHSRMFKKIVQREAGCRERPRCRVRVSRRTALGDHPSFPTPEEDAPLLSQLPTPIVNAPLLMEFPTPKREFPLQLQFPTSKTNAPLQMGQ